MIRAHHGSITDELGADAIINASNPALGLGSGVSGAIAAACGPDFQRQVRQVWEDELDEPLEPDDCLITGAGAATRFRWVLHVASVDYMRRDPETGGVTGPTRIRRCMSAALVEATRLAHEVDEVRRLVVATPLLGAGHGGLGPIASLESMMRAIRQHIEERGWELGDLIVVSPNASEARLVEPAALRFGVPLASPQASSA